MSAVRDQQERRRSQTRTISDRKSRAGRRMRPEKRPAAKPQPHEQSFRKPWLRTPSPGTAHQIFDSYLASHREGILRFCQRLPKIFHYSRTVHGHKFWKANVSLRLTDPYLVIASRRDLSIPGPSRRGFWRGLVGAGFDRNGWGWCYQLPCPAGVRQFPRFHCRH